MPFLGAAEHPVAADVAALETDASLRAHVIAKPAHALELRGAPGEGAAVAPGQRAHGSGGTATALVETAYYRFVFRDDMAVAPETISSRHTSFEARYRTAPSSRRATLDPAAGYAAPTPRP